MEWKPYELVYIMRKRLKKPLLLQSIKKNNETKEKFYWDVESSISYVYENG